MTLSKVIGEAPSINDREMVELNFSTKELRRAEKDRTRQAIERFNAGGSGKKVARMYLSNAFGFAVSVQNP